MAAECHASPSRLAPACPGTFVSRGGLTGADFPFRYRPGELLGVTSGRRFSAILGADELRADGCLSDLARARALQTFAGQQRLDVVAVCVWMWLRFAAGGSVHADELLLHRFDVQLEDHWVYTVE